MKIIIAGAGEVGFHLAKLLSFESHDITLIDNKKSSLNIAENKLDIKTIEGNAASISVLNEANVENSDLVECIHRWSCTCSYREKNIVIIRFEGLFSSEKVYNSI